MATIATVRLLDLPYAADRDYDYLFPEAMDVPEVGRLLTVPFGAANRPMYALLTALREEVPSRTLKEVGAVLPEDYRLTAEGVKLCFFLREHALCSVGDAVRAAFPSGSLGLLKEQYFSLASPPPNPKNKKERLHAYIAAHGGETYASLAHALGEDALRGALMPLCRAGLVERRFVRTAETAPKTKRFYTLLPTGEEREALLRGDSPLPERHRAVCLFLSEEGGCFADEIKSRLNISDSPLQTLVKRGILAVEQREVVRNPYAALAQKRDTSPVVLTRAQRAAHEEILTVYEKRKAACVLLHGVTGSGKTKVMIALLDRVIAEGGQAILLVPEIALTPQTVGIFCARYGERVSVQHSSLSIGERHDAYRRILRGEVSLVIGTRSAVFAPLSNLSLIMIDEEHEHTYKSDASPRYHTRDVAAFRSAQHGALTLLASATPAIESYYKAKTGKYTLVSLTERYGGTLLPETEIVDMREELKAGNTATLSVRLSEALRETRAENRQAVLFLNRRGYHHTVSCRGCGEPLLCPHCSVSFTYHTGYTGNYLLCHACGAKRPVPKECPACGGQHLSFTGAGTQKVQAELSAVGDGLRVLRMDADTTAERTAYERILSRFRAREADVLLGTQMVTKGHDFPAVGLSGVILADTSLYSHDFRAAERTFSLLTQVIGRAGRAGEVGKAIIQTFSPKHPVLALAAKQDYPAFYEEEIAFRRAMQYPPFCDIVQIALSGTDEVMLAKNALAAKEAILTRLRANEKNPAFVLYGPLEAGAYKVAERFRLNILVKCRLSPALRRMYGEFLESFGAEHPKLTVTVDFNPTDL